MILTVSAVSDGEISLSSAWPRSFKIFFAEASRPLPSSVVSLTASSGSFAASGQRTLQDADRPLHGGEHLGETDATVFVGVEQLERVRRDLDARGRAAQRDPELGVELGERGEVCAGVQPDLIESACAEEAPAVSHDVPLQGELLVAA